MKVFLVFLLVVSSAAAECDPQCQFNKKDSSDCKDYGVDPIDKSNLIGYPSLSELCLASYNITNTILDPFLSCDSVKSFVHSLRNGALSASPVRLKLTKFYTTHDESGGPKLRDSFSVEGKEYDCSQGGTDACFSGMKTYFATVDGEKEMKDICASLKAERYAADVKDQQNARNLLCKDHKANTTLHGACSDTFAGGRVLNIIKEYLEKDSSLSCDSFKVSAGNRVKTDCQTPTVPPVPTSGVAQTSFSLETVASILVAVGIWL